MAVLAAIAVVAAALAARATTAARADPAASPELTTAVTSVTTATAEPMVPAEPTTAPGTEQPVPTTPDEPTATAPAPPCVEAGPLAVLEPGKPPQTSTFSIASATPAGSETTEPKYPEDGSLFSAEKLRVGVAGCISGLQAPGGTATTLAALSVLGGSVEADAVEADLVPSDTGDPWHFRAATRGLRLRSRPVSIAPDTQLPLGDWGVLHVGARELSERPLHWCAAALRLDLTRRHAGFPAGTKLLIGYACADRPYTPVPRLSAARRQQAAPHKHASRRLGKHRRARHAPAKRHRQSRARVSRPLTVTPPLGLHAYVFPVAGSSSFGDTYGAVRSDVPGGWHHGDDIFAALGTPVVAVANGTLNRVGWERVGGWRLWVRDRLGNEFYYAHLSGYTLSSLRSKHVKAGQVIGFIGNTGDAFSTPTHLHFEIHPRKLLHLHYDGAVDPTKYLERWRHVQRVRAPRPVHPAFPPGPVRTEARDVFRQLLAARHVHSSSSARRVHSNSSRRKSRPLLHLPYTDRELRAAAQAATLQPQLPEPRKASSVLVEVVATAVSLVLLALWMVGLRLYRRRPADGADTESGTAGTAGR
jgi:murein DD-endopeptidase MepM/ murein hydrolase activator NlpD